MILIALAIIFAVHVISVALFTLHCNAQPSNGTSGNLGLFILMVLGLVSLDVAALGTAAVLWLVL